VGPNDDFIWIDSAVDRDNSGGPTFDMDGNDIGVDAAIHATSGLERQSCARSRDPAAPLTANGTAIAARAARDAKLPCGCSRSSTIGPRNGPSLSCVVARGADPGGRCGRGHQQ
jgi:hypothetical protein